jgi:hypothetical protein
MQILMVVLSVAGLLALTVSPAAAGRKPKPTRFSGAATGSVHCAITVTVRFAPKMNNHHTTAKSFKVRLSECVAHSSNSAVRITAGIIKDKNLIHGSLFTGSVLNCNHPAMPSSEINISWKGTYNGSVGSTHFVGKASFFPSDVTISGEREVTNASDDVGIALPGTGNSARVDLSFAAPAPNAASATLYVPYTASQMSTLCAGRGFNKLVYTGTITVGHS